MGQMLGYFVRLCLRTRGIMIQFLDLVTGSLVNPPAQRKVEP